MNKIYIVTYGQHSDYVIDAVFSEKSLAKKYIDSFKKDDYGDRMEIEEWDLDKNSDQLKAGRKPFHVQIKKDGEILEVSHCDSNFGFNFIFNPYGKDNDFVNIYCHADNELHAIKIAGEKRTQILANNQWGKHE